ncbi:hypothetical protein MPSEU_001102300 [Mayamaea pseudoterrestris]|nr:hypothetical protein MPSEU_001102300 [Mayamaea pseudoterrestris]
MPDIFASLGQYENGFQTGRKAAAAECKALEEKIISLGNEKNNLLVDLAAKERAAENKTIRLETENEALKRELLTYKASLSFLGQVFAEEVIRLNGPQLAIDDTNGLAEKSHKRLKATQEDALGLLHTEKQQATTNTVADIATTTTTAAAAAEVSHSSRLQEKLDMVNQQKDLLTANLKKTTDALAAAENGNSFLQEQVWDAKSRMSAMQNECDTAIQAKRLLETANQTAHGKLATTEAKMKAMIVKTQTLEEALAMERRKNLNADVCERCRRGPSYHKAHTCPEYACPESLAYQQRMAKTNGRI